MIFAAKHNMFKTALVISVLFLSLFAHAQQKWLKRVSFGLEQDLLPYATGGYFAGVWTGIDQVSIRALTAKLNKPDFIVKDGFTNNKVTACAMLADYFLKDNWKGWWAGAGWVY
jgi:hypothetical protein